MYVYVSRSLSDTVWYHFRSTSALYARPFRCLRHSYATSSNTIRVKLVFFTDRLECVQSTVYFWPKNIYTATKCVNGRKHWRLSKGGGVCLNVYEKLLNVPGKCNFIIRNMTSIRSAMIQIQLLCFKNNMYFFHFVKQMLFGWRTI